MNSGKRPRQSQRPGGWTLVELLVAVAVISIFLLGVVAAFTQILRASDRSERMMEAYQNARAAVETIGRFVKAARIEPGMNPHFLGINVPTSSGDRVDNDKDGRVDEERPDGFDDDGDWAAARDDRHAQIGGMYERPRFVGVADLGDEHVDEDCVFNLDHLAMTLYPDPGVPGSQVQMTSFSIGVWEGENNVLLQLLQRSIGSGMSTPEIAPLAHNVLSLNFLYWDANVPQPYWVEQWDAASRPKPGPGIELPASVYISVTVYAGRKSLDQVGPNELLETMTASTIVNIESVIHDPRYESVRTSP
jgi:prepilin-type N-terminal cleavage/methylation domain-containing protein